MRLVRSIVSLMAVSTVAGADDCRLLATSGDFEHGAGEWQFDGRIVPDPRKPANHVLALRGEVASASAPLTIPESVDAVQVRFRVLAPTSLKLRFDSKLVLRVRIYSEKGNSRFDELEITPSDHWQTISVRFSPVSEFRHHVLVEALNADGPFYLDDFCVTAIGA